MNDSKAKLPPKSSQPFPKVPQPFPKSSQLSPKVSQPVPRIVTEETIHDEHKKSIASLVFVFVLALIIIIAGFYALRYFKSIKVRPEPEVTKETQTIQGQAVKQPEVIPPTPTVIPSIETPEQNGAVAQVPVKEPDKVVEEFYNWYTNYNGNPIADGAYKTNEALSEDLVKKIEVYSGETDPFLCTKEKPSGFEVEPANTTGSNSSLAVNVKKDNQIIPVKINLKLNGAWKMINVTCLSGNGERSVLENIKQVTGLDYVTLEDSVFYWSAPDYKGRYALKINGLRIHTTNTDLSPKTIDELLLSYGFKNDTYNINGYKKDDIVCVDSGKMNPDNKLDVDLNCGKFAIK